MGYLYETKHKLVRVEGRRESIYLTQKKGSHILVYGFYAPGKIIETPTKESVCVELSKEYLRELIDFVKKNPEVLKDAE